MQRTKINSNRRVILWLDDDPNRAAITYQRWPSEKRDNTVWCSTAKDTIFVLRDYGPELLEVYLDHDLGGESFVNSARDDCGMAVIRWLESLSKKDIKGFEGVTFICHSHNLRAGYKMVSRLKAIGLLSKQIPFGEVELEYS